MLAHELILGIEVLCGIEEIQKVPDDSKTLRQPFVFYSSSSCVLKPVLFGFCDTCNKLYPDL